jgi:hypothetical protein
MDYIIGLLIGIVPLLCIGVGFFIGIKFNKKSKLPKLSEEEKRKTESLKKEFAEILAYNMDKAIKGGGNR